MTTTTINSNPTILAQAKAFLNTPVAKKTAVAVASLAAAAAVASVTYNNFFQNTSNSPQTDLMFTEAFPDVMNTANQCFNTTLISNFANSNIPQNVNGTNFCDLTPPQTFIDITKNVNPNVLTNIKSVELTLPQTPANVTNTNVSNAVELMFPLRFANVANTGAQCLNTSLIQTLIKNKKIAQPVVLPATKPATNQTIAENKTKVKAKPEQPQNEIRKETLPDGRILMHFDSFGKQSDTFLGKASNAISSAAQKVSDALTEVRNFGHETIFPRF